MYFGAQYSFVKANCKQRGISALFITKNSGCGGFRTLRKVLRSFYFIILYLGIASPIKMASIVAGS